MAYPPPRRRIAPLGSGAPQFAMPQGGGNANSPLAQRGSTATSEGGPQQQGGGVGMGGLLGPAMMVGAKEGGVFGAKSAAGASNFGPGEIGAFRQANPSWNAATNSYIIDSPNKGVYGAEQFGPSAAESSAADAGGLNNYFATQMGGAEGGYMGPEAAVTGPEMYGPGMGEMGATAGAETGAEAAAADTAATTAAATTAESAAPAMVAGEGAALGAGGEGMAAAGLLAPEIVLPALAAGGLLAYFGGKNGWFD